MVYRFKGEEINTLLFEKENIYFIYGSITNCVGTLETLYRRQAFSDMNQEMKRNGMHRKCCKRLPIC
jgi:hypothetical protein